MAGPRAAWVSTGPGPSLSELVFLMENGEKSVTGSRNLYASRCLIIQGELTSACWALEGNIEVPQAEHGAGSKETRAEDPGPESLEWGAACTRWWRPQASPGLDGSSCCPAPSLLLASLDKLESCAIRILGASKCRPKPCPWKASQFISGANKNVPCYLSPQACNKPPAPCRWATEAACGEEGLPSHIKRSYRSIRKELKFQLKDG